MFLEVLIFSNLQQAETNFKIPETLDLNQKQPQ